MTVRAHSHAELFTDLDGKVQAYLWPTSSDSARRLRHGMDANGFITLETGDLDILGLICDPLAAFADMLYDTLSIWEQASTPLLLFASTRPSLADFGHVMPVNRFIAARSEHWLGAVFQGRRYKSLAQPIVTPLGDVFGHEYLFRGLYADGGMVTPEDLFHPNRSADTLQHLDQVAANHALASAHNYATDLKTFINARVSTVLADQTQGPAGWLKARTDHLAPTNLVIELAGPEEEGKAARLTMAADVLRAAGFQIALDNVGAGFHALRTIPQVRPDFIKLDRNLVAQVDTDARTLTLLANIIDAAKDNGIASIALGVESKAIAEKLLSVGCDYLQGYHFGPPMDVPVCLSVTEN